MRKLTIAATVIGVLGFSSVSNAESYVSAYLGTAIPHEADFSGPAGSGTVDFDSGLAIGAKAGHWFNNEPRFGVQLDLNHHTADLDTIVTGGTTYIAVGEVNVTSLTVNALVRLPEGKFRPYAGIGGGFFNGEVESGSVSNDDTVFGWQVLAGVDIDVAPKFSIFGEYKYSAANFDIGSADTEYSASQIYGGVSYHF